MLLASLAIPGTISGNKANKMDRKERQKNRMFTI